jgi:uncharacterized protein YndB with AHSA1/START domain
LEKNKTILTALPECIIVTNRMMPFSTQLVYDAWSKPEYLKNWWGPNGFTNTFHEFDFRPGGLWRFIMHGPDGKDYPNESRFVTILPVKLLVFDHLSKPQFQVNTSFEEISAKATNLTFKMIFTDKKVYQSLRDFCAEKNEENFDRLEAELKQMQKNHAGK